MCDVCLETKGRYLQGEEATESIDNTSGSQAARQQGSKAAVRPTRRIAGGVTRRPLPTILGHEVIGGVQIDSEFHTERKRGRLMRTPVELV